MTVRTVTVRSTARVGTVLNECVSEILSGSSGWARRTLEEAARELADQIRREYALKAYGGTDQSHIHWKTSKAAEKRGGLTLIETGSVLDGLTGSVISEGGAVIIRVRVENTGGAQRDPTLYFKFIFEGTKDKFGNQKLPPRPAWPTDGSFPDEWTRLIGGIILGGIADEMARRLERG